MVYVMEEALCEKAEYVLITYKIGLDLEIAYLRCGVSEEERELLEEDETFRHRVRIIDTDIHEDLIAKLRDLAEDADSESVRLQATRDLGKIFYPKRFREQLTVELKTNNVIIYLPEKDKDGD